MSFTAWPTQMMKNRWIHQQFCRHLRMSRRPLHQLIHGHTYNRLHLQRKTRRNQLRQRRLRLAVLKVKLYRAFLERRSLKEGIYASG